MARHGGEADRSLVRPSPGLYTAWVASALAIAACRSGNATTPVDTPTTPVTSQPTTEPAPAIEQFARDNSDRLTVVGVGGAGTLEIAQDFVVSKSTLIMEWLFPLGATCEDGVAPWSGGRV